MKKNIVVLYVADQDRSARFYSEVLERKPVLNVPGMTEFELSAELKLGLMPEEGIARILLPVTPHPATGSGIPRCELYLFVDDPADWSERAVKAGGRLVSGAAQHDWGDIVAYCQDPDGHVLAFAK